MERAAQSMPLATTADAPLSIGVGGLDVDASPVSTSPGSNADGAMPSPVLGRREARRLEWTAAGPTGTVD